MKKILFIALLALSCLGVSAQTAQQVLYKTAALVGRSGGASARFSLTSTKYGNASGSIAIKGNKFNARTSQAIVWYDGSSQWTYMKNTNEVNISKPNQAKQMSMNPLTFINIYKSGYNMELKMLGGKYEVHLTAKDQKRSIAEMYIYITPKTYVPSQVKMRQDKTWSNIYISSFKAQNQANSTFVFNSKEFPTAEVIDLR